MIYGYARCSTNENLQDIERQVRELNNKVLLMKQSTKSMKVNEKPIVQN